MVTELKESRRSRQRQPVGRKRLTAGDVIEQALSELHSNSAVPEKWCRVIQTKSDIRKDARSAEEHRGHQENNIGNLPLIFQGND